jgi:hypothetical protein
MDAPPLPQPGYSSQSASGGFPLSPVMSPVGGYQVGPPAVGYGPPRSPGQQVFQEQQFTQTNMVVSSPAINVGSPMGRPHHAGAPPGIDVRLWSIFQSADTGRTGQVTEQQLGRALVNDNSFTPFDPKTVKLMVKMFDVDQ